MMLISPIYDHEHANAYACYLADVRHKDWENVYLGARWELALSAYLGIREQCVEHLARVNSVVLDDFEFDFRVGQLKIDAKATLSKPGMRNNLIITRSRLRSDVAYALGDMIAPQKPKRNSAPGAFQFDPLGWVMGDSAEFHDCPFRGMKYAVMCPASKLAHISTLRTAVGANYYTADDEQK